MANEQAKQFLDQATQSLQSGQFAQALELVNQAIAIDPADPEAYILRGICFAQTSQPDQATESFQKAIMLSPNNSKAYYNLSVHFYGLGRKPEALEIGKEALRIDPQHGGARDMVNRIEGELNPEMKAQQQAQQPQGSTPGDDLVREPERQNYQSTQQQGFQQPPQGGGYYRPGYQPSGQPVHSLQFVEKMGGTWTGIGWGIIGLAVATFILSILLALPQIDEIMKNPGDYNRAMMMQNASPLRYLGYIPIIGSLVWMIMDIIDRRGNWLWLLPQVLCCCCGANFVVQAVYMLSSRKQ